MISRKSHISHANALSVPDLPSCGKQREPAAWDEFLVALIRRRGPPVRLPPSPEGARAILR